MHVTRSAGEQMMYGMYSKLPVEHVIAFLMSTHIRPAVHSSSFPLQTHVFRDFQSWKLIGVKVRHKFLDPSLWSEICTHAHARTHTSLAVIGASSVPPLTMNSSKIALLKPLDMPATNSRKSEP